MSQRSILKKEIDDLLLKIADLEERRTRSEAELVSSLVKQDAPKDEEIEYFNSFTQEIHALREELRHKQIALYSLDMKRRRLLGNLFSPKKAAEEDSPAEPVTNPPSGENHENL